MAAVIVNYRTPDLTVACLQSLAAEGPELGMHAVVVDNASRDDSVPRLRAAIADRGWSDWVDLVSSPSNTGFSGGNNRGIRHVDAESYLLINSDAAVLPGAIAELFRALDADPAAGVISPRLLLPDGSIHHSCYRFHTPVTSFLRAASTGPLDRLLARHSPTLYHLDEPAELEWTSFACVLIRRAVLEDVGPMDEGYFMYFEDQDYCRRARARGWKVLNWPYSRVVHAQGQSGNVRQSMARRERLPRYYYASRARYLARFYGRMGLWATNLLWIAGRSISKLREVVERKPPHLCDREAFDIWTNCFCPMRYPEARFDKQAR